ncbi:MAG: dihydrofolate reductase family protein [Acidobacteria bacterium]|nr:dihydrofolate reductase family protein [Acidobacteriota bacterium]
MSRPLARPRCFLNVAMSLDGKIASSARGLPTFPSHQDRLMMDRIRARSDAVLIGAATLRAADFPLRIRSAALRRRRVASGRPEQPLNILLSGRLRVPLDGRFFSDSQTRRLVVTTSEAPKRKREDARRRSEVLEWKGKTIDLRRLMGELHRRGIRELLLEGGGSTNFEFFRLGLVDEIYMTLCPVVIGGAGSPTPADGAGFKPREFLKFSPTRVRRVGGELFLHYHRA